MKRAARWLALAYFAAMAVAVTFPGVGVVNTIRPFVLGVPFVFAWYLMWVLGGFGVFVLLYWSYRE